MFVVSDRDICESVSACVLVPIYRPEPSRTERISLQQLQKKLGDRSILLAAPEGLDPAAYYAVLGARPIAFFDPAFFASRDAYNRLMVHEPLYRWLADYEFHLVHQTDAFVIEDQLDYWVGRGYDYIGSPFWDGDDPHKRLGLTHVGNGGFCLRRTDPMLRILIDARSFPNKLFAWVPRTKMHALGGVARGRLNEERFWSGHGLRNVAPVEEGVRFAFEMGLEYLTEIYATVTPFGCHHDWNIDYVDLHRRGEWRGEEPEYERVIHQIMVRTGNLSPEKFA
jgi:hypothetical protein